MCRPVYRAVFHIHICILYIFNYFKAIYNLDNNSTDVTYILDLFLSCMGTPIYIGMFEDFFCGCPSNLCVDLYIIFEKPVFNSYKSIF